MTAVGIVGSRSFFEYPAFVQIIVPLLPPGADRIVSGGAPGVDTMAERFADERGIECTVYATKDEPAGPFWKRAHGRNQKIADDLASHDGTLIALPGPKSKGTWVTVRMFEARGLKAIVCEVPR